MGIASNARWTEPADRLPEMTRPAWQSQAACRGADTNLFFTERWEGINEEALAICAGCAVRKPCLDYALDNNETHGTWGAVRAVGSDRKCGRGGGGRRDGEQGIPRSPQRRHGAAQGRGGP